MSIKKITAEEAIVKTASVELKTLTISGKQVTLAVFRQLEEEWLLDAATCELAGVPWGRVNYHPDPAYCKDIGSHIHVIWQRGAELRRGLVYAQRPSWQVHKENAERAQLRQLVEFAGEAVVITHVLMGRHVEKLDDGNRANRYAAGGWTLSVPTDGRTATWSIDRMLDGAIDATRSRAALQERLAALAPKIRVETSATPESAIEAMRFWMDQVAASEQISASRNEKWERQYLGLLALDQLFIAV